MSRYPKKIYAIFPHDKNGNTVGVYVGASARPEERIKNHAWANRSEPTLAEELHQLMRDNGFHYFILDEMKTHKEKNREYEWVQMFMGIQMKVFNTRTYLVDNKPETEG